MNKPKLIVVSAPSGAGKTTIAREILQRHPEILFSISATTRSKREHEIEGRDYFFLTRQQFESYIDQGRLIEWEQIYGDYYGTLKSEVENALRSGKSMLFDIDVKGALSIKKQYPTDSLLVFISPPNVDVLTERLIQRKTEDEIKIRRRLDRVPMELELSKEFDVYIVNDALSEAINKLDEVISSAVLPQA